MPDTLFNDYLNIVASDGGGTLAWTAVARGYESFTVFDDANDGDVGSVDYFHAPGFDFTGYYYTAPNGNTYAIYSHESVADNFYIPYNPADYDLAAVFPATGSTSDFQAENFWPTGNPLCFLAGSLIATPSGEVAVEQLQIGDQVLTAAGASVPVKWIGRQTVVPRFGPAERLMPVRFAAGSLGDGLPHTVFMSPPTTPC